MLWIALVLEAMVLAPASLALWPTEDGLGLAHLLFFLLYLALMAGWLVSGVALVAVALSVADVRAGRLAGASAYRTVAAASLLCMLAPWTFLLYSASLSLAG